MSIVRRNLRHVEKYVRRNPRKITAATLAAAYRAASDLVSHATPRKQTTSSRGPNKPPRLRLKTGNEPPSAAVARFVKKHKPVSTNALKAAARQRTGRSAGPGRSGGFIYTHKIRKTPASKMNLRGIDYSIEVGGTVDAADTMWLGHATCPLAIMQSNAVLAMLKKLFLQVGADTTDLAGVTAMAAGDIIRVFWSYVDSNLVAEDFVSGGSDSLVGVANWFVADARPWNLKTGTDPAHFGQTEFWVIEYVQAGSTANPMLNPAKMQIKQARVHFDSKSALKMQNATVQLASDQEDYTDVDNCPIYGKVYEGSGTGAVMFEKEYISGSPTFYANRKTGVIVAQTGDNTFPEPVETSNFDKVTLEGRLKLEPGEIKTSVLHWKSSMPFNDFWSMVQPGGPTLLKARKHIGKYRLFAVEKMIRFTSGDAKVKCLYELQTDLATTFTTHRSIQSGKLFDNILDQDANQA